METLLLERKGAVGWVWLNRPRRLNAINNIMLAELRQTFEDLDQDRAVGAIVLAGHGPAFCAGFDIAWMGGQDAGTISRELPGIEAVYDSLEACTKPVIAAVQGPAIGGGLLLALITDLCLAAEGASFGAPEVKIGIFPNLRLIPRLERMIGLRPAKRLVLTGDALDASEAQRLGLVDRVLPAEVLHAEAQVQAEQLAGLPAVAVRAAKATFARVADPDFTVWEREQFATCWARPERESAMRAFLAPR